ncbi:hypothetical protein CLOM_g1973 [Closterium sp. NIES-68]|nr:hypothetical protein CLOM_g1973 [Closterium sp. NIES-68]GJP63533.1 hypothetical protein CLOP_g20598 [Closterium sp. NIES-67]
MFHLAVFEEATCRIPVVSGAQVRVRGAVVNIRIPVFSRPSAATRLLRGGSFTWSPFVCLQHGSSASRCCSGKLRSRAFHPSAEEPETSFEDSLSPLDSALHREKPADLCGRPLSAIPLDLNPGRLDHRETSVSAGNKIHRPIVRSPSHTHTLPAFLPLSLRPQRRPSVAASAVSPRTAGVTSDQAPLNQLHSLPSVAGFNSIDPGDRTRRTPEEGSASPKLVPGSLGQGFSTWSGAVGLLAVLTGQLSGNLYRLIGATAALSTSTATCLPLSPASSPSTYRLMDAGVNEPATVTAADIGDVDQLQAWLEARLPGGKAVLERWGSERGTKRVANLWQELTEGEVCLVDSSPPLRKVSVVSVHVRHARTGRVLVEAMQEMADGTVRARNRPLSEKMRPTENPLDACRRGILEELGDDLGASDRVTVLADTLRRQVEERDSFSYPGLRTQYEIHVVGAVVAGLPDASFCTVENEGEDKDKAHASLHRCAAVRGDGPCLWAASTTGEPGPRPCGRGGAGAASRGAVCSSEGEAQGSASDGEQRALGVKRHFWVWTDRS